MVLRRLFGRQTAAARAFNAPPGERLYAIGDIHGRRDCLNALLAQIDADDGARAPARTTLVFLGDYIDRGPSSRGVIDRLIGLRDERACVFLGGNHEDILLRSYRGDRSATSLFHRVGGRATMLSYGVPEAVYDAATIDEAIDLVADALPDDHIAFMMALADQYRSGDYLFAHAGIRPGIALDAQEATDLRWIRRDFTDSARDHGVMVVHGHTITDEPELLPNRIGIDTGAFRSGRLTALGIEASATWLIATALDRTPIV